MNSSPKKWDRVTLPCPHLTAIMENIGECISRDTLMVKDLGWEGFMREKQGRRDFTELGGVEYPDRRLLRQYLHRGTPLVLLGKKWM